MPRQLARPPPMLAQPEPKPFAVPRPCARCRGRFALAALAVVVVTTSVAPGCRLVSTPSVPNTADVPAAPAAAGAAVEEAPGSVTLASLEPDGPETAAGGAARPASEPGIDLVDDVDWCRPYSFRDDLHGFVPMLKHDGHGLVNWNNGLLFGAALAGSVAMRDDLDDEVRREVARHPERWGTASNVLGRLGEVQYQVPVLLAVYGYSLREQDPELHDLSASLISAYTLTGLTTTIVKGVSDTDRPSDQWNDGHYGFPSFHAASSMSIAAVLDEYYGPKVGLPAMTLAGLIGWSRIDERDHDLSDVVFGAAVGYLIGKSVAGQHLTGDGRVRILPWAHPTDGTPGLQLNVDW